MTPTLSGIPKVEAALQRTIDEKGQGSAKYRIILPDGSLRMVSAVEMVVLDERGGVSRVLGIDMDVTKATLANTA